ncbi:MAG: single-stranded-DNA-specific exonuclease RecJ [SAR324 cluster bacterium]|nr:single-stranded-DNA-specific exonuclease RecJ [SAR324 cluster bacterium]
MIYAQGILTDRVWTDPEQTIDESTLNQICAHLGISSGLCQILAARDVRSTSEISRFLNPGPEQLHDPFLMAGMEAAVARIRQAILNFEKILIFGDYDVDGTASAAILYNYFKRLGARVHYFLPNRLVDGYGLNVPTIDKIHATRVDLLITVDNGSTACEESKYLKKLGIDLIITDHHKLGPDMPTAVALVNPHQPGCGYPFKNLSATGVAYKLICALDNRLSADDFWDIRGICHTLPSYYLDLVALATVADMSPLVGENRVLVKLGLEMINTRPRPGLAGLIKECNVRSGVSPNVINFKIAPKINALGRIGDPALGIQMLLTRSFTEGRRLARHLVSVNRSRQEIEKTALAGAMKQAESQQSNPALVLVGKDWHPGVISIIATRIAGQFQKPTVVISLYHGDVALGSARGNGQFDILHALGCCESTLKRFGGHVNAAGLALHPANLSAFTAQFMKAIAEAQDGPRKPDQKCIAIDTWIQPEHLDCKFIEEIGRLSPFGFGNPEPVIAVHGLDVGHPSVFQNRHLKLQLNCAQGHEIEAVAWDHSALAEHLKGTFDIAFVPQLTYSAQGVKTQLKVVDLRATA